MKKNTDHRKSSPRRVQRSPSLSAVVWLAFDLGVKGDYEALYEWLDAHSAVECTENVARFSYEYTDDLVGELKQHLATALDIGVDDRRAESISSVPTRRRVAQKADGYSASGREGRGLDTARRPQKTKPMSSSAKTVMVDTGCWYALCDAREGHHAEAVAKFSDIEQFRIALPWPCLYETLNTRLVKQALALRQFTNFIKRRNVEWLNDGDYRDAAYELTVTTAQKRPLALVDMVMRLMLDDVNVRVHALLTFNAGDFYDVCRTRNIQMIWAETKRRRAE